MAWSCSVYKFAMAAPDDVSGLEALLDGGVFKADEIICIIAKTEGNGRVNDFSRPLAHRVFRDAIAARTGAAADEIDRRVAFVMSGGCEGARQRQRAAHARSQRERPGPMSDTAPRPTMIAAGGD